jgi:hypothetical protein
MLPVAETHWVRPLHHFCCVPALIPRHCRQWITHVAAVALLLAGTSTPSNPNWSVVPKSPTEWKAIVDKSAVAVVATLPEMRQALGVTAQPTTIAGVKAFVGRNHRIHPAETALSAGSGF